MTALDDTKDPSAERSMVRRQTPLEYVQSDQYLLDNTSVALQKKIDQIKALYDTEMRSFILSHYELGLMVKEVYDDDWDRYGKDRYGSQAMKKLCAALPWAKSALYEALHLVNTYTREQAEELVATQLRSGESLSWSHVRSLATVSDKNERSELLQRTVEENWTAQALGKEIIRRHQLEAPKKPRRLPAPPSTLSGLIQQQRTYADAFLLRDESAWKADGCGLMELSRSLSQCDYTEEGAKVLEEHAQRLRRLAKAAEEQAQAAEAARDRYMKTLERIKAKPPLAVEDTVEEADEEE